MSGDKPVNLPSKKGGRPKEFSDDLRIRAAKLFATKTPREIQLMPEFKGLKLTTIVHLVRTGKKLLVQEEGAA